MNWARPAAPPLSTSSTAATTQSGLDTPYSVDYESALSEVFVTDSTNNRVMIFSTSSLSNGENASNVMGQDDGTFSGNPVYTTSTANDAPNAFGFNGNAGIAIDPVNHRLFVSEKNNDRVLVFTLNTDNSLPTIPIASYVLGQANFRANSSGTSQSHMAGGGGLAFDAVNNRLFAMDGSNNRVLVFNTSSITNGMNAANVLGQSGFGAPAPPRRRLG
jgi:hypothetical protein